jgi:hypothetical protein
MEFEVQIVIEKVVFLLKRGKTMTRSEAGRLGGISQALKSRKASLEAYYRSPNFCGYCGKVIKVGENEQSYHAKKKKFCNRSCAASFNNSKSIKREAEKSGVCKRCKKEFDFESRKRGGYKKRDYCDVCLPLRRSEAGRKAIERQGHGLSDWLEEMTRAEVRKEIASPHLVRVYIIRHSRRVYKNSLQPFACKVCGYSKAVDICHKRPVSSFGDDVPIKIVNAVDNLVALCKNHHWELDHDLLDEGVTL